MLTVLPEALRTFDRQFPGLRMVIYALLLVLMMIFRPQGIFPARRRQRELAHTDKVPTAVVP